MRYLIATLASHGYIYSALGVAHELKRRGHTVAFVTGASFGDMLAEEGFERIPFGVDDLPSFAVINWGTTAGTSLQLRHTAYAYEQFKPDVILAGALPLGPVLFAKWYNVPCAVLGLGTYVWPQVDAPQQPERHTLPELALLRHNGTLETIDEISEQFGMPSLPVSADFRHLSYTGDLHLLRSVPELQGRDFKLQDNVRFIGSALWEPRQTHQMDAEFEAAVRTQNPILFVQHNNRWSTPFYQDGVEMSGIPDFWPYLFKLFADKPVQIIAATNDDNIINGELPANFYVRKFIPHQVALPYADAVLTNGTSSIMLGALSHGLPMGIIITASESYNVADVCDRAAVSVSLAAHDISYDRFAATISRLMEDRALYERATAVQTALNEVESFAVSADLLEQLASRELVSHDVAFA